MQFNNIDNQIKNVTLPVKTVIQNVQNNNLHRFIPDTTIHEHESIIFSDCKKKMLDLNNLYMIYSEEKLINIFKDLFLGFDFYQTPFNFLAEFVIMSMHEVLSELEFKTFTIDSQTTIINSNHSDIKRPIKTHIELCKKSSLMLLNYLRIINYEVLSNDKNTHSQYFFNMIDESYNNLINYSKDCVNLINSSNCNCKSSLKRFIVFINIFKTVYESKENKIKYLPWLYNPLGSTPLSYFMGTFSSKSTLSSFTLMKKAKIFAHQINKEFLKYFEDCSSFFQINKDSLIKSINKKEKSKIELLLNYLEEFITHLKQYSSGIEDLDIFLESGEVGKEIYSFLVSHPELNSEYFDIKEIEKFEKSLNLLSENYEKKAIPLLMIDKVESLQEKIKEILNKINSSNIKISKHIQNELANLENRLSLSSCLYASRRPYIQLICTFHTLNTILINFIKDTHKLTSNFKSEEIIFNNGHTIISNIKDKFNTKEINLPKKQIIQNLDSNNQLLIDSERLFAGIKEHLDTALLYLNIKIHTDTRRVLEFKNSLTVAIDNTKYLIILYKEQPEVAKELLSLRQELVDIHNFFNKHKINAFNFFTHKSNSSFLTLKENEQKEQIFLKYIGEMEKIENLEIISNFDIKIKPLFNENEQLKILLNAEMRFYKKSIDLIKKLKSSLLPEHATTWKIENDNYLKVEQYLFQIKCINERFKLAPISNEFCDKNDEVLFLEEYQNFTTEYYFAFWSFTGIGLPLTEKWFKLEKIKLKEIMKNFKSSEKNKSKTSQKHTTKTPSSKINNALKKSNLKCTEKFDDVKDIQPKDEELSNLNLTIEQNHDPLSNNINVPRVQDSEEEHLVEPKNIKNNKKEKSSLSFKFPNKKKEKTSNNLSFWDETVIQIENIFKTTSIFQVTSEIETRSHLLGRLLEFTKGECNIHFNLGVLKDVMVIPFHEMPQTINWLWSQCWPLITDCALRSMITATSTYTKSNKEFNLYTHDGIKLYNKLNPHIPKENIPNEVIEIQESLNHSYVGSLPPTIDFQRSKKKELFNARFQILKNEVEKQKKTKEKIIEKNDLENLKTTVLNFLNRELFFTMPEKGSLSIREYLEHENAIHLWINKQAGEENAVIDAKNNLLKALNQCWELVEHREKIKTATPTLYCTMVANVTNRLMSNVLHLFLAKHDLLKGEISNRPVIHCHHPLKLWQLIIDNKIVKDEHKIEKAMERFSADSRYPYGKKIATEENLVKVYEIQTALTSKGKLKGLSSRIEHLTDKYSEQGEEQLQSLVDTFEFNLKKCFDIIGLIIKK